MRENNKFKVTILLIFLLTYITHSQENKVAHYSSWNALNISKKLNENWFLNSELHLRRTHFTSNWEQFIFRPSLHHKFEENLDLALGYSYIQNYNYSEFSTPIDAHEHNIFQQLSLNQKFTKFSFNHRLRFEERFIDNIIQNEDETYFISGRNHRNRFRYKFLLNTPIKKFKSGKTVSIMAYNEAFLDFGNTLKPEKLDQNWMFFGIGFGTSDHFSIVSGYHDIYSKRNDLSINNQIWETIFTYKI